MTINEIFRKAKREINFEIKELKRKFSQELREKDKTIKKLKCQLAELAQVANNSKNKPHNWQILEEKPFSPKELRLMRTQRGMTQKQMAQLLGFSILAYCSWENGRNTPRESSIKKMTDLFKLSDKEFQKKFSEIFPGVSLPAKEA